MKLITVSKIGYNHPSQANWSYGIWKVDLIDTKENYCMSYTVKENFGGDSRLRDKLKKFKIKLIETKAVYTSTGTQKITGIASLLNMESDEFIKEVVNFIKPRPKPTHKEVKDYMELHNADEVGQGDQAWTMEDARYHLELSDK